MTREEVLELTLQVIKGKMWWETNGEVIIEVALAAAEHERQPLTDGQLFDMAADYYEGYGFKASEFARAIERAHGIGAAIHLHRPAPPQRQPLTDELLNVLERVYWTMKDDMPVELRSECFNALDRCGVKV